MSLDAITAPVASVSMNSQKITNLSAPTIGSDAMNMTTADGKYYLNTTTLDSITAPVATLNMSSQKITALAEGTTYSDAVTFNQLDTLATSVFTKTEADARYY